MNTPEVRSVLYGWITLVLTSVIGGIGWWIKHIADRKDADRKDENDRRDAAQKADDERDPQRQEIFTKQMQILLDDSRQQVQTRDDRIDRRDVEIAALKQEIDRLRMLVSERERYKR